MKCKSCFINLKEHSIVYLSDDTTDSGAYCYEHRPENSKGYSVSTAAIEIGKRMSGTAKPKPEPQETEELQFKNIKNGKIFSRATIKEWADGFNVTLLDTSYYNDLTLYTAKEYEEIVPRDIQVIRIKGYGSFLTTDLSAKTLTFADVKPNKEVIEVKPEVVKEMPDINIKDITFEVVKQVKPDIDFQYMFVKDQLSKALVKYEGLVVTEDNLKSVKEDITDLGALKKKISRFRIDEKAILMKPINEMDTNLKDLEKMVEQVIAPLKKGKKVFDDERKAEAYNKRIEWLNKEYDAAGIRPEFRDITVEHNTKKKDIVAAVEAKLNYQQEKDNEARVAEQSRENDIAWIKNTVQQQANIYGIRLNLQKYINKYENGTDVQQIMSDIVSDAQDINNNRREAVQEHQEEVAASAEEIIKEPYVKVPEIVDKPDVDYPKELNVDPETGEIIKTEMKTDAPTYKFVIEIDETIENLTLLKDFLDTTAMNYNGYMKEEE